PSPSGEGVPHARLAPSRSELACEPIKAALAEPIKAALAVDFVTAVEEVPAQAVFRAVEGVGPFELLDASLGRLDGEDAIVHAVLHEDGARGDGAGDVGHLGVA